MQIRPVGAEFFFVCRQTDGRPDMTKLVVTFRYFANVPKNYYWSPETNVWVIRCKESSKRVSWRGTLYLTLMGPKREEVWNPKFEWLPPHFLRLSCKLNSRIYTLDGICLYDLLLEIWNFLSGVKRDRTIGLVMFFFHDFHKYFM